jgi:hypothetical protein
MNRRKIMAACVLVEITFTIGASNHKLSTPRELFKVADSRVLKKAVIPAAGLGTRLLLVTKVQPERGVACFRRKISVLVGRSIPPLGC